MTLVAEGEKIPLVIWVGFLCMIFGNFMAILDIQIVASSLGSIQAGLGASRSEITRVQSAYLIGEVIGIALSGYLGRALGIRILFTGSALAFGAASWACALAWDMNSLVAFRAIQGFVGAAMIPTTMATIFLVFPKSKLPMASTLMGFVSSAAPSLGPTIGGMIAEHFGWRALFTINVIPSIAVAFLVWRFVKLDERNFSMLKRIDYVGLIALALFLGCLEYTLEEAPSKGWFSDGEIVLFGVVSLFAGMLFFWRAITNKNPIVDLRPLTYPVFATGAGLIFIVGFALFGPLTLQPLFLAQVRGLNSEQVGHLLFAQGLTMMFVAPVLSRVMLKLDDLRPLGFLGFLLVALSCWMQSQLTAQSGFNDFVWPQVVRAIGIMMAFTSLMQPAMQSLPPHIIHAATGQFNLIRNLGGAVGLALLSTLQQHSYALHRQELYTNANIADPYVQQRISGYEAFFSNTGGADPHRQAIMSYVSLLDREALVMMFNDMFLFLAALLFVCSFFQWLMKPKSKALKDAQDRDAAAELEMMH
ncbi:MAG: DHA2 family efflux MFS transporter permease subunit [Caulobacterales bacterium]